MSIGDTHCRLRITATADLWLPGKRRRYRALQVACQCGAVFLLAKDSWGTTKSCGCIKHETKPSLKHGKSHTPLYTVWAAMLRRSGKKKYYKHVAVCAEWTDFERFEAWALASGYRYGLELDRIDNRSGYNPGNCRWATRKEQHRNKKNNVVVRAFGEEKCLAEWAEDERCAVPYGTLHARITRYGWSAERAIITRSRQRS